jgi:hypothetical protein
MPATSLERCITCHAHDKEFVHLKIEQDPLVVTLSLAFDPA